MSEDFQAKVAIPTDLIQEFVELISNKDKFDKWKAIALGLKVAQWLVDTFANTSIALGEGIPEGRISQKKVAEALSTLANDGVVAKGAIPAWLLMAVIKLVINWMAK
jgi:hypothetical protein